MGDSLRDQLLRAGFKEARPTKPERTGKRKHTPAKPPRGPIEPDLAQAFALRARADKAERQVAQRETRAQAQAKRERKRKLTELLGGKALNVADAKRPRNFEFAGKIRRVYVSLEQLERLNTGELGVVMHGGRALVVTREVALQVQSIAPEQVALLVDPDAPAEDDGVPDDLVW